MKINSLIRFCDRLISHVTNGELLPTDDYINTRNELIKEPSLRERLPDFLTANRSVESFSAFMRKTFKTYAERREFINAAMAPLMDLVEFGDSVTTDMQESCRPRAFISYSSKEKVVAGKLKKILESYEIDSFLAHEDIEVSMEWQKVILEEAQRSQIFVFLLSENSLSSPWCQQEIGLALASPKNCVIPLSLDQSIPMGFLARFQASRVDPTSITIEALLPALLQRVKPLGIDICLKLLRKVSNYRAAERALAELIKYLNDFSDSQASSLIEICVQNSQIRDAVGCARDCFPTILERFSSSVSPDDRVLIEGQISLYSR